MSLINEKRHDIYDYKPSQIDEIIDKLHQELGETKREIQKDCPSCKSDRYSFAFDKYSFHYVQCQQCMSLYIQNALSKDELLIYDQKLQEQLYSHEKYDKYLDTLTDKMSFELELVFSRLFSKKQSLKVAYLGHKSKVYKDVFKDFNIDFTHFNLLDGLDDKKYDLIIIDHIMEKINNLNDFLKQVNGLLNDDGFLYMATRVGSGIDILTLWEDSKIYPLEHNNLLSIDGIKILLNNSGFAIKALNTPGVLDIDNILKTQSKRIPRFLDYLKQSNNKKAIEEFQTFVQKSLLSSFATVIAQRG